MWGTSRRQLDPRVSVPSASTEVHYEDISFSFLFSLCFSIFSSLPPPFLPSLSLSFLFPQVELDLQLPREKKGQEPEKKPAWKKRRRSGVPCEC